MDWYYADESDNQVIVDESRLHELVASQTIKPTTLVWNETMNEWKACAEVRPDLFGGGSIPPTLSPSQSRQAITATQPGIAATPSPTDSVAVCALVFGIIGIVSCITLFSIAAIVCGHIARKRALENPSPTSNAGMALAGLITGYAGLIVSVLVILGYLLFFAAAVVTSA